MSKRDWKIFVQDMLEAIDNILEYTSYHIDFYHLVQHQLHTLLGYLGFFP